MDNKSEITTTDKNMIDRLVKPLRNAFGLGCPCPDTDDIIKKYLENIPVNDRLPDGWEVRFGLRGKFMKYDDIEHAERKNMVLIRETGEKVPFGYANKMWDKMKAKIIPGDELWIWGNDGMAILLVRDDKIIDTLLKWTC